MKKWERRLSDAAHALSSCGKTYFEPELFRRNVNQFLTVCRTVTFLIAKDKATIPNYEEWQAATIAKPWSTDQIMKWAKDSRNFIEKEGDLDLYSSLTLSLIYSYFSENDISVEIGKSELVRAGVSTLMRIAEKKLPPGIADGAAVKIERRWVANSLPEYELFQAMLYVYSRYYKACAALAEHLGGKLGLEVPKVDDMGESDVSGLRASYVKFNSKTSYSVKSYVIERNPNFAAPAWLKDFDVRRENFEVYTELAEHTFNQFGNHMSMTFLFSEENEVLQQVGSAPADQVDKYLFWRRLGEQILYLRADSLIFITETWLRKDPGISLPIRQGEIIGEALQVYEIKRSGDMRLKSWNIIRENGKAKLAAAETRKLKASEVPNFLAPIKSAFSRI